MELRQGRKESRQLLHARRRERAVTETGQAWGADDALLFQKIITIVAFSQPVELAEIDSFKECAPAPVESCDAVS